MTYMDYKLYDAPADTSMSVIDLQNATRPYMTTFEGSNFLDWSKKHGFPMGQAQHPLEEAHAAAAKYLLELGVYKV